MISHGSLSRLVVQAARSFGRHVPRYHLSPSSSTVFSILGHGKRSSSSESAGNDPSNRPRAVIFDLGGVVVPSPFPVFAKFERDRGLLSGSLIDTIQHTGSEGAWARLERGELSVGEFARPFSEEYQAVTGVEVEGKVFKEFLEGFRVGRQVTVRPVVQEVIERLRRHGIKTAVLTNNFRYDDGGTLFPKDNLKVDVVVESCVEGCRKPEGVIYQKTLRRLGVEAGEAVFLDDIGSNLKAAQDMGIHTIKVEDISEALSVLEELMNLGPLTSSVGGHVVGTTEVDPKLLFPVEGLVAYLRDNHGLVGDELPLIRQFKHGQSNPTYYIEYGGAKLVLRKKPPGKLLPSAHAVEREYRVMKATGEAGVPIPDLLSLCEDESVIGTPFYVMKYVPGLVLKDPALPAHQPTQRKIIYDEMVRVLASIHSVDVERAGLNDFGKHGSYLSRQVGRWTKQYVASETHTIPAMDRLSHWLNSTPLPPGRTTVVHGDFRLDNLIYSSPEATQVVAVLDWELSTLGDPVSDLAYVCMPYHMDPDQPQLKGLVGLDLNQLGIPSEDELIQMYCRHSRQHSLDISSSWSLYLAFTFFRVAAILQGVYRRALQKQSSASNAESVGLMAEDFAKKGWHFAQKQQALGHSHTPTRDPSSPRSYSTIPGSTVHPVKLNTTHTNSYSSGGVSDGSLTALMTGDVASFPPRLREMRVGLIEFMRECVVPNERAVLDHHLSHDRWTPLPLIEEMKSEARSRGLWNLFLPVESDPDRQFGAGLTNLEYAHLAELMGQYLFASEVFNCSAPDTGNMEVLVKYGTQKQKEVWLAPLLAGDMRSCFAMTEPNVASSDATNIQSSIVRGGDSYTVNGHKWWISGAMDPRCKMCIFMGKTDPDAPKHKQQSMILVPMDSPGVQVVRPLSVFGYDDAPSGHAEMVFSDVRVPVENMLLGEGRGFEIAQGRLGPGRIHHCMRLIGMAERALELMTTRVKERVAFGKTLGEQGTILSDIAQSRIEIEQARLLTLKAAHKMDTVGNKAAREDIAMIKVVAPQMAQRVVDRAIQAHGAMGLSGDRPLAHFFSWARILRLADGPDEVHTAALGKMELKR